MIEAAHVVRGSSSQCCTLRCWEIRLLCTTLRVVVQEVFQRMCAVHASCGKPVEDQAWLCPTLSPPTLPVAGPQPLLSCPPAPPSSIHPRLHGSLSRPEQEVACVPATLWWGPVCRFHHPPAPCAPQAPGRLPLGQSLMSGFSPLCW
jgi:hypothetical protein